MVEHLERLGVELRAQHVERRMPMNSSSEPPRRRGYPHEAAVADLAAQLAQADSLLAQPVLIARFARGMSTQLPQRSNCQAWNMQVMWFAVPDGSATSRLPDGLRTMMLPRCGQTLRNARIFASGTPHETTGSLASVSVL